MHPKGPAEAQREVVIGSAPGRYRRSGNARHAILLPGRGQAVPVDQAWLVDFVLDPDPKRRADIGHKPECPVWLPHAIDRSRLAIHHNVTTLQLQDCPRRCILSWPASTTASQTRRRPANAAFFGRNSQSLS